MLSQWEVPVPGSPEPALIIAHSKAEAIQVAIELFPGINPNAVTRSDQWL